MSRADLESYRKNEAEIGRLAKAAEARAPKLPTDDQSEVEGSYDEDVGDDPDQAVEQANAALERG